MKERPNDRFTFHPPDTSTHREVPVAGGAVEAGFPSPADDFLDAPLDLNREFVQNPASTFFVRVSGESMAGDGIGDGDLLIGDGTPAVSAPAEGPASDPEGEEEPAAEEERSEQPLGERKRRRVRRPSEVQEKELFAFYEQSLFRSYED